MLIKLSSNTWRRLQKNWKKYSETGMSSKRQAIYVTQSGNMGIYHQ
jgi:hypothetical protein